MQINLGHVTASFTLDVYGHTENVLAVRGSDYRILFDGEGGERTIPFSPQSSGGLRNVSAVQAVKCYTMSLPLCLNGYMCR